MFKQDDSISHSVESIHYESALTLRVGFKNYTCLMSMMGTLTGTTEVTRVAAKKL